MKKRFFLKIGIFVLLCFTVFMTGCNDGKNFNEAQEEEIRKRGESMLMDYIESLPAEGVKQLKCYMMRGIKEGSLAYGGDYLSGAVYMEFEADGERYEAVVNTDNGDIYSNYYLFPLERYIKDQLLPYCTRYGFDGDFDISRPEIYYPLHFSVPTGKGGDGLKDVYSEVVDMLPASFDQSDEAERAVAFLKDAHLGGFDITVSDSANQLFDPRILTDYLKETGNYRFEKTRARMGHEYTIFQKAVPRGTDPVGTDPGAKGTDPVGTYPVGTYPGAKGTDPVGTYPGAKGTDPVGTYPGAKGTDPVGTDPESEFESLYIIIKYGDSIDAMPYTLYRNDKRRYGEFSFVHVTEREGSVSAFDETSFMEADFPILFENERIVYEGSEPGNTVYMYFEKKPSYETFIYNSTEPLGKQDIELIPSENSEGKWTLAPENGDADDYYLFVNPQVIEYR